MISNTLRVPAVSGESFEALVLQGLAASPKWLPTRFLYDQRGSAIFEKITELPEYYPTRAETEILQSYRHEILKAADVCEIIEFGSGSSIKTHLLLDALITHRGCDARYVPIDISGDFLAETATGLKARYPDLTISPVAAEYFDALDVLPPPVGSRLFLFLGSNIGNFESDNAERFLAAMRRVMLPGDSLLLGLDQVKDPATLIAAYDDASGTTASFTKNLLERANRELEGDFNLDHWLHDARWNAERERMEMGLVSLKAQSATVCGQQFDFAEGERVQTEFSHKYTRSSAERMAERAGFRIAHLWTDSEARFVDALWIPA